MTPSTPSPIATHHHVAVPVRPGPARRVGTAVAAAALAAAIAFPTAADAHGGIGVAEGGGKGVQIAVQGSEAEAGDVDLATTLAGPGTGKGSKVVYWIRPKGRERAVRIATDRDESGIHHAEIPTSGRGSWQDWDVSAYVTLNTGKRLRVTNDKRDPPGPVEVPAATRPTTTTPGTATAQSGTAGTEPVAVPAATVDDVSGESDGAPGWVLPSLLVVLALAAAVTVRARRGR